MRFCRTAVKSRHLESIKTALNTCESSGITTGMDIEVAQKTMVELEREAHKVIQSWMKTVGGPWMSTSRLQ